MGDLDEILRRKQAQVVAAQRAATIDPAAKIHAARDHFAKVVTDTLVDKLKGFDRSYGTPKVMLGTPPSADVKAIEIRCDGAVHIVFQTLVTATPAAVALMTPLKITITHGSSKVESTFIPAMRPDQLQRKDAIFSNEFVLQPAMLKRCIIDMVNRL